MYSFCIDILCERIRTPLGYRDVLIITHRFTKHVKSIPVKSLSAAEVSKTFFDHWVFNFGPPTELISDNGRQFTSNFFIGRLSDFQHTQHHYDHLPPTNKRPGRTIHSYHTACLTRLYQRPSSRLEPLRTSNHLCIQLPPNSLNNRHPIRTRPLETGRTNRHRGVSRGIREHDDTNDRLKAA